MVDIDFADRIRDEMVKACADRAGPRPPPRPGDGIYRRVGTEEREVPIASPVPGDTAWFLFNRYEAPSWVLDANYHWQRGVDTYFRRV